MKFSFCFHKEFVEFFEINVEHNDIQRINLEMISNQARDKYV